MQKVYLLWLMPVCVGLIILAGYFCQSPRIKGRVYFNYDECKAAYRCTALLVQSGAFSVSHDCYINFFAIVQY